MALRDLLWACPACGEDRGLANDDALCHACGTRFLRGSGATIRAVAPGGSETTAPAAAWLDRLPKPASLLGHEPVRTARVTLRRATSDTRVFGETGYLNSVEIFGEGVPGRVRLERHRLVVEPDGQPLESWPLESLTAVQASSNSLQLKRRDRPLTAFRFHDDAIYLWEHLLRAALRDLYHRTDRGKIREFQPRIVTHRAP